MDSKKIVIAAAVLVAICFFIFLIIGSSNYGLKQSDSNQLVKIKIGDWPSINGLPEYLAIEKGYFKEAGIEVERMKFETPSQMIDALLQGKIDFGSTTALGITAIVDQKNPGKIKVFGVNGGTVSMTNESLLVPVDSNISSFKELKGKKLGIPAGTIQWRTIARELLARDGLGMDKDLEIIELSPALQVQAIASRQVDALLALEPIPTIAVAKGVAKIAINGPAEQSIAVPFYPGAATVSADFARKNPETTRKVIEVFKRANAEIMVNPDESKKFLVGYTSLTKDIASKVQITIFKSCNDLDSKDLEEIEKFYSIFYKYKVVPKPLDFNSLSYCNAN
jgi:NitT/TauT family transport system substrate-binding protein